MQARLLYRRISQAAILAKAAFFNSAVQSTVPTTAYVQRLLSSPLYFLLKSIGPSMAPTINDGVAERAVGQVRDHLVPLLRSFPGPCLLTCCQAVLFRSISVLDEVRVGDIVAVSSPPLPIDACSASSVAVFNNGASVARPLGIRRVAAVAGDELVACDDGEVLLVPPGFVWLTCDNANGSISSRIDSRVVGPVSLYDVYGRALSLVTSTSRPAALSTNAMSISEDSGWARFQCFAAVVEFLNSYCFYSIVQSVCHSNGNKS
jgi:hypothetical protein